MTGSVGFYQGLYFRVILWCPQFLEEINRRKVFKWALKNYDTFYKEGHGGNN